MEEAFQTLCFSEAFSPSKFRIILMHYIYFQHSLITFIYFLQLILKNVDSLLYVDTDILFLQPVEDIWALLSHFNSSHLAAMAPEHEEPRIGWYNRFARHPFYGRTGVNSGVMLMNMTRLRENFFKVMGMHLISVILQHYFCFKPCTY